MSSDEDSYDEEASGSADEEEMSQGGDEGDEGETMAMHNPTSIRERIDSALHELRNFRERSDKSRDRGQILSALAR